MVKEEIKARFLGHSEAFCVVSHTVSLLNFSIPKQKYHSYNATKDAGLTCQETISVLALFSQSVKTTLCDRARCHVEDKMKWNTHKFPVFVSGTMLP